MRNKDKGRLPPFVALLKETMASPAWRATSHGARSLYTALKARYSSNLHNNGRIFISQRNAMREVGSWSDEIARWFRELQHYGFIVQTSGGCLGVDGKGKAPHWRLTECGYMRDLPTRDFMKWDGTRFKDTVIRRRKPGRVVQLKGGPKKQNPVRESPYTPSGNPRTPMSGNPRTPSGTSVRESPDIQRPTPVRESPYISRLTTPSALLPWSEPSLVEVADPAEAARIRLTSEPEKDAA